MSFIQYSGYSFPDPLPTVAESPKPIYANGLYDHSAVDIELVGLLTGSDLSGLHLQKQQMISGLLNEYGDLTVSIGTGIKVYEKALPSKIDFAESDLTTVLPYTASFMAFESGSFSQFFGVSSPKNEWSFQEQDNQIITATHSISAQGEKVDGQDALQNAIDFVTGLTGYNNLVPHNSQNAFLKSRSENINRKTANYSITETYHLDGSNAPEIESGIVTFDTTVNYNKDGGFTAGIQGSIYGGFNGPLVNTGLFTPQDATQALIDDVANSMSTYDSGAFSFVRSGPSTYSYNIDTGTNNIDFSFTFVDLDNVNQIGNVAHKYKSSVSASKDSANVSVTAEGELYYNGIQSEINTGEYENSTRFQEIQSAFATIDPYLIATQGLLDFNSGNTTFDMLSCEVLNSGEISRNVTKDPVANRITYNYQYDTLVDISTGELKNLRISITDKIPLQLSSLQQTLGGFAAQQISDRTLGEYSIAASASETTGKLDLLKSVVSNYMSGDYTQSDNHTVGVDNISYNISKFY